MQHAEDNQFGISEEIIEQLKDDLRISHESPRSAEKLKTFDGPIVEVDSLVREEGDDSTFIERDSCEDSDGLDYAVSGEVDFLDEQSHVVTWEDTCIEQTNVLYEWYCSEDLIPKYEAVNCVRGCDEGICIGGMVSTEASADDLVDTSPDASDIELLDTCIETDGGNDPYTRGDLTIAAGAPISDWCNSAGRLIEYYCESGSAIEQSYEVYDCATSCVDGACETPPIEVE